VRRNIGITRIEQWHHFIRYRSTRIEEHLRHALW
jgi:hypothetical protein